MAFAKPKNDSKYFSSLAKQNKTKTIQTNKKLQPVIRIEIMSSIKCHK